VFILRSLRAQFRYYMVISAGSRMTAKLDEYADSGVDALLYIVNVAEDEIFVK